MAEPPYHPYRPLLDLTLGLGRLPRRPRTTQAIGFRKLKRLRRASDGLPLSPADEQKSLTVPGNGRASVPAVSSSPGFSARSGATASKTPNDAGNRVQEAQAAQAASDGLPLSPADEQKSLTVPGNGRASVPAASSSPGFKAADGTVIARDESMKVVRFLGNDLSDRDCHLLTTDLTLHSSGKAVLKTKITWYGGHYHV